MRNLVTGATGYIGGRLVPRLLADGHEVVCMTRDVDKLADYPWRTDVEAVSADALERSSLAAAMTGVEAAFYLIHSMGEDGAFTDLDRRAADNFSSAAVEAGVGRIVYLGGLGSGEDLSPHLESRQEVGRILASGATPVTELRAAVIIGSGSVSFEMLRYLTEVLPAMVTPKWVRTVCQPIAVEDVLTILAEAVVEEGDHSHVYEIGGPDRLTYEEMMRVYAEVAGLRRRLIVPVPLLSPRLSSLWIGAVTPLPTGVARPLVDSLRVEVTAADNSHAERVVGQLIGYREAVARALSRSLELDVLTRWSDAARRPAQGLPSDPDWAGGKVVRDRRELGSMASPAQIFRSFTRIGGDIGYYGFDWAWAIRGMLDILVGGVGLRRGRRHPDQIRLGEALDFWRVVRVEPDHTLQLFAEMKMPGKAWLTFSVEPSNGGSRLVQEAVFVPRGLMGRLYWLFLVPFHGPIFGRMAERIVEVAESTTRAADETRIE